MGRFQVPNRIAIMYVVHKIEYLWYFLDPSKIRRWKLKAKMCGGNVIYHVMDSKNTIQLGSRCSEGINLTYVHND